MSFSASPLARLLSSLRQWMLRVYRSHWVGRALLEILHRLVYLVRLLRSKVLPLAKVNDDTLQGDSELDISKNNAQDDTTNQTTYTIVQHGDTISLNEASFSLYPFSSDGIRNSSRSSIRLGSPPNIQSRSLSRTSNFDNSSDSHSIIRSIYDLPLNPYPLSMNSPGQLSVLELHTGTPGQDWYRTPPPPEIQIELASDSGSLNDSCQFSPLPSPPPARPENMSPTSLRVPLSLRRSITQYQPPEIGPTSPNIVPLALTSTPDTPGDTHKIIPVLPDDTLRYSRRTRTRKEYKNLEIDVLTTIYDRPAAPAGWLRFAHPEGACYYHHPEKRVYTDSHISDPEILYRMMDDISRLEHLKYTLDKPFPLNAVLMIDVDRAEGGDLVTSYYYADHDERTIFFLHPLEAWDIPATWEISGVRSYRHLGYHMHAQYWYFVSLYPNSCFLSSAMICELRDIVLHLIGDTMTSPYSTSPYTMEVLFKILTLTSEMEKNAQPGYPGCMGLFARHMYIFNHTMFLNFHGESFARIERDFSVFGDPVNKRTWLIISLSFILFSAPDVHLRNLQKMWVDGIMHKAVWEQATKNLNDEWQEYIFFACLMLISNVGFLSAFGVHSINGPRSAAQILNYLSVVADIASMILGMLLLRQNRTKNRDTADDVQVFLRARNHPRLGLETLAILYSLPYALLMWGVVAFVAAFGCVFFQDSDVQTRSLVGAMAVIASILILWCIITSWENKNHTVEERRPLSYEELECKVKSPHKPTSSNLQEDSANTLTTSKYSIFAKIRSLSVLSHIRTSVDSEKTAV